ncbi:MAG TPA: HAD hydrolase-like protein [Clostridia bacterium]|nr:HAD hydrolase-like protein [Clostridia bacterium]
MKLKYLLFDLDGTLIDSSRCIFKVYTDIFNELGIPLPDDRTMQTFIGPPIEEVIVKYYDGDPKKVCDRFREIYATVDLAATNSVFEGVREMLSALKNDGYVMCVATTKFYVFAEKILNILGIRDYFDLVQGSNAKAGIVGKSAVINALFNAGVEKDRCLLIGDTVFDVEGAEEIGIPVAIVRYGFGREKDFIGKDIVWFADTAEEVAEKVRSTVL